MNKLELIKHLEQFSDTDIIVLSSDSEGNRFSEIRGIEGGYNFSEGEIGFPELTQELISEGYQKEDLLDTMLNTLIQGDCLEVMRTFESNSIDLTVTSPPYDNLRTYNGFSWDFEGIAKELYRVTKQGGVVVWVVGDATIKGSETGTSFKQALYFKEVGFNLHDTMIWEKDGCIYPETNRYYPIFEYMFILSKGKPKTCNQITDRKNKNFGQKIDRERKSRIADGSFIPTSSFGSNKTTKEFGVRYNIWKYGMGGMKGTKDKIAYKHPATFPEKLAEDHILSWSNEGDTVLDCFAGSGTTLKMAKKNNRKYIGIEISEEYCNIILTRLGKH